MNNSWLNELEKKLEQRFDQFLQTNSYQKSLFLKENQTVLYNSLITQQKALGTKADIQRKKLLKLANKIKDWKKREHKAYQAGAIDLANRANKHLLQLMEEGRNLWRDFEEVGQQFQECEKSLLALKKQADRNETTTEESWAKFETKEELEQLRKKIGLNK